MAEQRNWAFSMPRHAEAERIIVQICGGSAPPGPRFAALGHADWLALEAIAMRTRTANLLRRYLADNRIEAPDDIRAGLDDLYRRQSIYGLEQRMVLGRVSHLLGERGIPNVALKGAALAFTVYPQPAMRPLRDIDILVPADRAEEAHRWLRDNRFALAAWAQDYGTEYNHQLPELVCENDQVTVEIHHRIFSRDWHGDTELSALLLRTATMARLGKTATCFAHPLANLLHLTVHATLHNCFENGPLTIADVHALWRHPELDREELVAAADGMALGRSLDLLLAIARHAGPIEVPAWLEPRIGAASPFVDRALDAMFQLPAEVEQRALVRRLQFREAEAGPLAALRRMIRPTPQKLAELAGTQARDRRRWIGYPAWLWQRGRNYLRGIASGSVRSAAHRDAQMLRWLRQDGGGLAAGRVDPAAHSRSQHEGLTPPAQAAKPKG